MTASTSDDLARLGAASFVSLTTFRRSGEPVATAVWVVRDGDHLLVWTGEGTGKVTRVRRDPRVTLARCGRLGKVRDGEPVVDGTAQVLDDEVDVDHVEKLLHRTYGLQFRLVVGLERLLSRGPQRRVAIRIALAS